MPDIPRMLAGSAKYMSDAVPQLIAGCKDRDHNVRQCSVYGLGILAQQHHEAFRASLQGALMAILGIVTAPGARSDPSMWHLCGVHRKRSFTAPSTGSIGLQSDVLGCLQCKPSSMTVYAEPGLLGMRREEENEMATENAIAALGRTLENHGTVMEESAAAQSWNVWVNSLPVEEDKVEAKYVHAQLVRHVEASDAR